jgi:hypothetical protein
LVLDRVDFLGSPGIFRIDIKRGGKFIPPAARSLETSLGLRPESLTCDQLKYSKRTVMSSQNPFLAPETTKAPPPISNEPFEYNYLQNFTFLFESPNWLLNWLLVTVVFLIPVVGPIVLIGYQYEIIAWRVYYRQPGYPDFDFGKFGAYLTRGVWPFLVSLVLGLVMIPVAIVTFFVVGIGMAAVGGNGNDGLMMVLVFASYFLFFVVAMLFQAVMIPLFLRAGIAKDFIEGFNFRFAMDFLGKTWVELILGALFIAIVTPFLAFAGLLALCVGYLFVLSLVTMATAFHHHQLYRLYLSRGGELIPFKPSE